MLLHIHCSSQHQATISNSWVSFVGASAILLRAFAVKIFQLVDSVCLQIMCRSASMPLCGLEKTLGVMFECTGSCGHHAMSNSSVICSAAAAGNCENAWSHKPTNHVECTLTNCYGYRRRASSTLVTLWRSGLYYFSGKFTLVF